LRVFEAISVGAVFFFHWFALREIPESRLG